MLIQIKNRSGRGAIRDAFLKLGSARLDAIKPESGDVTFVGLLLSFGAKMAKSERYVHSFELVINLSPSNFYWIGFLLTRDRKRGKLDKCEFSPIIAVKRQLFVPR